MEQQDSIIKWGILGCGNIADHFAEDLKVVPNAQLYAVASRNTDKARDFGNKHGAIKSYGSYEALASDPEVQAIYIATPHPFHCKNTMLCLENGKAVLCEKPFAMNTKEVKKMIAKAKTNKVLLMEALWTRFLPNYEYVLHHTRQKTWGEIKEMEADFGFQVPFDANSRLYNKELGGGSLLDIGIYPIFLALSLLGYPEKIEADAQFAPTEVDEILNIRLTHKNKAISKLYSTFKEHTPTQAVIQYEKATLIMHTNFYQISEVSITIDGKTERLSFEKMGRGYYREAAHFGQLIREGKTESPMMPFDHSLKLMRLLDEIRDKIGLSYS
ncbi:Gfo/Idh/MocA family protein [Sungkyunkwania multivorans]|uniref:Gfo/Idh/MocA family protein n=1 Tax=Sungkyunkwania multivorans TaxID=1173618 RepID=A0ABW3CYU3_9FLAO